MIESCGQSVVSTDDVMHHRCQIAYPDRGAPHSCGPQPIETEIPIPPRVSAP
jgi:hypothetical protein